MSIQLVGPINPPDEVVVRLKQIDPHLSLRFVEFASDQEGNIPRWWALVWEWPENDPRHVRIANGSLGQTPFDVLGYLPLDCDVYSAFEYTKNVLLGRRQESNSRRLLERVDEYNRQQTKSVLEPIEERTAEIMDKVQGKVIPRVFQSGGKSAAGTQTAQ